MKRPFLLPALLGFAAVMLGAFGAHALDDRLSERALEVWNTANRYHFIHVLAILALGVASKLGLRNTQYSTILWTAGILIFSGGLYTYAVTGLKLGAMLAPVGGLSFAFGWLALLKVSES